MNAQTLKESMNDMNDNSMSLLFLHSILNSLSFIDYFKNGY